MVDRLKDYVRKLDPATNVGLNADSIDFYTVGEVCRRKGIWCLIFTHLNV